MKIILTLHQRTKNYSHGLYCMASSPIGILAQKYLKASVDDNKIYYCDIIGLKVLIDDKFIFASKKIILRMILDEIHNKYNY